MVIIETQVVLGYHAKIITYGVGPKWDESPN